MKVTLKLSPRWPVQYIHKANCEQLKETALATAKILQEHVLQGKMTTHGSYRNQFCLSFSSLYLQDWELQTKQNLQTMLKYHLGVRHLLVHVRRRLRFCYLFVQPPNCKSFLMEYYFLAKQCPWVLSHGTLHETDRDMQRTEIHVCVPHCLTSRIARKQD